MKRLKILAVLVLSLVLLLGVINLGRNNQSEQGNENDVNSREDYNQEMENRQPESILKDATISLYSEEQVTKWELSAEEIRDYKQPDEYKLDNITASIYEDEEKVLSVTSASGVFDEETGFLTLTGRINLVSEQRRIEVDRLNWNQSNNELTGRGNVLISQPGLEITADNFVSQIDLRRVNLVDDVKLAKEVGEENEQL